MPRPLTGIERKQTYSVTLEPVVAERLKEMGAGSLTAGIGWLVDDAMRRGQFTDLQALRDVAVDQLRQAQVERERVETEARAAKAAARAEKPSKRAREEAETLAHYAQLNAERFARGQELYNANHLSAELREKIYAAAKALYGWGTGPRPALRTPGQTPLPLVPPGAPPELPAAALPDVAPPANDGEAAAVARHAGVTDAQLYTMAMESIREDIQARAFAGEPMLSLEEIPAGMRSESEFAGLPPTIDEACQRLLLETGGGNPDAGDPANNPGVAAESALDSGDAADADAIAEPDF